ncbi:MAG: type II/IV secretion system ATPase subunit [Candidatus Bathyarchaeia archaeon]
MKEKIQDSKQTSGGEKEITRKKKANRNVKKGKSSRYRVLEDYWISNPLARVKIISSGEQIQYIVKETKLGPKEKEAHEKLVSLLTKELVPPETMDFDVSSYILSEAKRLAVKYKRSLGKFDEKSWKKIFYYVVRDLAGYGDLDVLIRDPYIEDISCNGVGIPVYVWHRKYESIPSNIKFTDEIQLNNFIVKLAHMSNRHISSAHPMLDAMLSEKHRLAATFMREVSTFGSSFCIRKFRTDPFSIVDLIKIGTLDEKMAAYLWILLENKMSLMIIGGTGAGKTSMLNALISLIEPNDKMVTVEEIAELSAFHENWVQLVSREGFRFGAAKESSISLFDLVKLSLRYRPDYIVVGEVRGEEAYALFQAVATGHGGMCTMHADSLDHAVKRLTSPPMNVAEIYIPLMNVGIYISRVDLPQMKMGLKFGRRVRKIWEIIEYGKYKIISDWSPSDDSFRSNFENSFLLDRIASKLGKGKEKLLQEIRRREEFLKNLVKSGKRSQKDVGEAVMKYYGSRSDIYDGKEEATDL